VNLLLSYAASPQPGTAKMHISAYHARIVAKSRAKFMTKHQYLGAQSPNSRI
jgi:hypothetical protein